MHLLRYRHARASSKNFRKCISLAAIFIIFALR